MKAVMYGAGNIGRGFIGQRFFLSGYETTFIDVNADAVNAINEAGKYPIYAIAYGVNSGVIVSDATLTITKNAE